MEVMKIVNAVDVGIGPGKNIPHSLPTTADSVYRVTGMDQIQDIIEFGCVRPKGHGSRRERVGDRIYWSIGGPGLYYHDKRPVIESSIEKVKNGQEGAISLDDLTAIWMFNEEQDKYINNIEAVRHMYQQLHPKSIETEGKTK